VAIREAADIPSHLSCTIDGLVSAHHVVENILALADQNLVVNQVRAESAPAQCEWCAKGYSIVPATSEKPPSLL
jgi:hypothetical protein